MTLYADSRSARRGRSFNWRLTAAVVANLIAWGVAGAAAIRLVA